MDNKKKNKDKKKRTLLQRIVNIFLYTGIAIFILVVIAFGFSQTSTFRDYLKGFVVAQADSVLNGRLHIDKIEGTIFTSLVLKNVSVYTVADTIFNSGTISIKTSPLHLLLKRIYVRDFEIRNANISLVKDKSGELNISKLFPSSQTTDTTKSTFPFTIQVAKFQLNNINFAIQNYDKNGSKQIYDSLNIEDLRLQNINLSLSAFADINNNDFQIEINNLSTLTNIQHFFISNFSGKFDVNEKGMSVNDLKVATGRSSFIINSKLNEFSPFDSTSDINTADIDLNLDADSVNFSDLSAFVPATNILKGNVNANIKTSGNLRKLNIDKLEIKYDSSQFMAKGNIRNLDQPADLYISTAFYNSYVNQNDINKLLPAVKTPVFPQLGLLKFDTLFYDGKPLDFNSSFYMKTSKGDISVKAILNLENQFMQYDINFRTINFDITPFAGINTNLNSHGNITGQGITPNVLNATVNYIADGSGIDGNIMDTLRLKVSAKSKKIKYNLLTASDTMSTNFTGNFDFSGNTPSYKFDGNVKDLNIAKFSSDTSFSTSLNFSINTEGSNFELDKLNLFLNMKLYDSYIHNIHIDSTRAIVDLRSNDNGQRIINIISDLADITLNGNFSIEQAISLINAEAGFISSSVNNKVYELFPDTKKNTQTTNSFTKENLFAKIDSTTNIQYLIDLKNFELISLFLGSNQLEVDGELSGEIKNDKDSVKLSLNSRVDYVKFWGEQEVFFLSNLNFNFNLKNSFNASSLYDISAGLNLKTDRVFSGSDIKNLLLNLDLSGDKTRLYFSSNMDNNGAAKISANMDFNGNKINLLLDTLELKYNNFKLMNKHSINIAYADDSIKIDNLMLVRENGMGELEINGTLAQKGSQNLKVKINNFRGKDLSTNLLEFQSGNTLLGRINLNADVQGDLENPLINVNSDIDSVTYKNKNLGALIGSFNYKNKSLSVDLKFIDSSEDNKKPQLLVTGSIPLDLGINRSNNPELENNNSNINLKLTADNFNLAPFGNVLPVVRELRGILTGNLNVSGTYDNIDPEGSLTLKNINFIADANNLEYNAGIRINVAKGALSLDSLLIANSSNTENGGKMTGTGKAILNNLDIESSQFNINGNLKVLSTTSKSASPSVYGDLVLATNGNIELTLDKNRALIKAPITITHADLIFPQTQGAYQSKLQGYIYKYTQNTSGKEKHSIDFESLVKLSQEQNNSQTSNHAGGYNFNYKIDVKVEKEAKIVFVLSKELNQKLTAYLSGNLQYDKTAGSPNAQGELKLLDGSNLQFFKTLTAEGTIRFESKLDNPYLDITATYTNYWSPDTSSSSQEEKVAVKILIQGPLNELDKNFIQEKNNIAVYVGQNAIDNNEPSSQYDASDAVLFIIAGRFVNQSTSTNTSGNALETASTSLAGSILGGFLNSYLGDYVKSIQLRKVGAQTKVNLVGRVKDFRYSIGGSTDVFQDLSQANVMIEYPIFKSLLVRLERKEALNQTGLQNQMINEIGLKYKFEF